MERAAYASLWRLEDTHWWFRGRRAVIRALLDRAELPLRSRILDAGCGTGRNLAELGYLGELTGVDASPRAVEYCHKRGLLDVSEAALPRLPFEDASFDLLLLADVIEHVEDDLAALTELRRVAARDAHLIIITPAYEWLWSHQDEVHHHYRRYTRMRLVELLSKAGWEPITASYFNSILLPPIALVRKLGRVLIPERRMDLDLTPGLLNPILQWPMRFEASLIRHGLRLPFGVSVGALCTTSGRAK